MPHNADLAMNFERACHQAAEAILAADALLIGAGAGMGVDSGLPDFRGPEGFWRAYPAFRGQRFADISNPVWFQRDPEQAWGFFGHRLNLYRATAPHAGFEIFYSRIAVWPNIPSTGLNSGKKNPVKPRPAVAGNVPLAVSPLPNDQCDSLSYPMGFIARQRYLRTLTLHACYIRSIGFCYNRLA